MNRILVVGAPRSGTTWLAATLGATPGSRVVNEPDNPAFNPAAEESLMVYGGYPVLRPRQRAPEYERLWDACFVEVAETTRTIAAHAPRFSRQRIAHRSQAVVGKSVFATFALDWLVERYSPKVVLIERHPLEVVASWMRLGFEVGDLAIRDRVRTEYVEPLGLPRWDPKAPRLLQVSWAVGVLMTVLRRQSRVRPEWRVVLHQTLANNSISMRRLAASVGLGWDDASEAMARRPADGRRYAIDEQTARVFLDQFPELASWLKIEKRS